MISTLINPFIHAQVDYKSIVETLNLTSLQTAYSLNCSMKKKLCDGADSPAGTPPKSNKRGKAAAEDGGPNAKKARKGEAAAGNQGAAKGAGKGKGKVFVGEVADDDEGDDEEEESDARAVMKCEKGEDSEGF